MPEENEPLVIVHFDSLGRDDAGVEWGNAVTTSGGDPVEYDITREQYDERYPDDIWDTTEGNPK